MKPIKTNRSIHAYLSPEEHERIDKVIEGLRTIGKGSAKINKGDVAAALLLVAVDDTTVLSKARAYLTAEVE